MVGLVGLQLLAIRRIEASGGWFFQPRSFGRVAKWLSGLVVCSYLVAVIPASVLYTNVEDGLQAVSMNSTVGAWWPAADGWLFVVAALTGVVLTVIDAVGGVFLADRVRHHSAERQS